MHWLRCLILTDHLYITTLMSLDQDEASLFVDININYMCFMLFFLLMMILLLRLIYIYYHYNTPVSLSVFFLKIQNTY